MVRMYHSLTIKEILGCLQFGAIMNKTAMNICVYGDLLDVEDTTVGKALLLELSVYCEK